MLMKPSLHLLGWLTQTAWFRTCIHFRAEIVECQRLTPREFMGLKNISIRVVALFFSGFPVQHLSMWFGVLQPKTCGCVPKVNLIELGFEKVMKDDEDIQPLVHPVWKERNWPGLTSSVPKKTSWMTRCFGIFPMAVHPFAVRSWRILRANANSKFMQKLTIPRWLKHAIRTYQTDPNRP